MNRFDPEETYKLEDLEKWDFSGTSLAVLGHPVRHSISPAMHNAAISELAQSDPRFSSWRYFRFEIRPEELIRALPLFHEKGFLGINLTVPHKEIVLEALERIDPSAREIGAVNTLRRMDGSYEGFNTDGYGLSEGVRHSLKTDLKGNHIVILGAGGAGRAAAVQSLRSGCRSLSIVNRNPERLAKLLDNLHPIARELDIPLRGFAPRDPDFAVAEGAIVINATSLGLNLEDPMPLPSESIPSAAILYDMIYNPKSTQLMQLVTARGGKAANGLSMLVHQGARSLEIWSGTTVNAETMSRAAHKALND